jgi:FtsZ-binding cell division protein ZapB
LIYTQKAVLLAKQCPWTVSDDAMVRQPLELRAIIYLSLAGIRILDGEIDKLAAQYAMLQIEYPEVQAENDKLQSENLSLRSVTHNWNGEANVS